MKRVSPWGFEPRLTRLRSEPRFGVLFHFARCATWSVRPCLIATRPTVARQLRALGQASAKPTKGSRNRQRYTASFSASGRGLSPFPDAAVL
jgi:hypothetical protein